MYCVKCGVELDAGAKSCPLCRTTVYFPGNEEQAGEDPFPPQSREVPPIERREAAALISIMLASLALCSGLLNIFLRSSHIWSLYVIGAAVTIWMWLVPPLLQRIPLWFRLFIDAVAVGTYVLLIAIDLDGMSWFMSLALPIVLLLMAAMLILGIVMGNGRSAISSTILVFAAIGLFSFGVEFLVDFYLTGRWSPMWSLIVLSSCLALDIPLIIVRYVPSLREEFRRRFHM